MSRRQRQQKIEENVIRMQRLFRGVLGRKLCRVRRRERATERRREKEQKELNWKRRSLVGYGKRHTLFMTETKQSNRTMKRQDKVAFLESWNSLFADAEEFWGGFHGSKMLKRSMHHVWKAVPASHSLDVFCALVDAGGDRQETIYRLLDPSFLRETRLICSLIDVESILSNLGIPSEKERTPLLTGRRNRPETGRRPGTGRTEKLPHFFAPERRPDTARFTTIYKTLSDDFAFENVRGNKATAAAAALTVRDPLSSTRYRNYFMQHTNCGSTTTRSQFSLPKPKAAVIRRAKKLQWLKKQSEQRKWFENCGYHRSF
eukprot:g5000.t1